MKVIERLKSLSLFKDLRQDEAALDKIARILQKTVYPKASFIIKEGESGDAMYILNSGAVRVEKKTASGDSYTVANLTDSMNVYFGEQALVDEDQRSASVVALDETECFVITKKDFESLCTGEPGIGYVIFREMAKSLSVKLRKATQDNVQLIVALVEEDELVV